MLLSARLRWTGIGAPLVVGAIWMWAGLLKVSDPAASVTVGRAHQLLPTSAADVMGRALPIVEVLLAACLVLGLLSHSAGGISIDCRCLGNGGYDANAIPHLWEVARDVGLLALSAYVAWLRRAPLALDSVLLASTEERSDVAAAA